MSWIHSLYETYEHCVNEPQFASNPPLPISHTTQQAHIEIVIDQKGEFQRARVIPKAEQTTLVPCTESSGGRSGRKPVNHPLSDKLQYVAGDFVDFGGEVTSGFSSEPKEPHRSYQKTLSAWAASRYSHPKLMAILKYVQQGKVIQNLMSAKVLPVDSNGKILQVWKGDKKDTPEIFKLIPNGQGPGDAFIRWRVEAAGEPLSSTWEDQELIQSWINYYASQQTKQGVCLVNGEITTLAEQHPAKLRNAADKAKLISSNDLNGYTFRGRFIDADQACGVGFVVTQKAHNALQWLIKRQGFRNGDQVAVAWSVSGASIPDPFINSAELFELPIDITAKTESSFPGDAGQTFALRLNKQLAGYRALLGSTKGIVAMAVDSASPGRMAITFYRELTGSEFLHRVQRWHQAFAWHQNYSKDLKFVGAPSPKDVAEAAYGRAKDDGLKKLHKVTVERLLPCIIDGQPIPRDLMEATVRRSCNRVGLKPWDFEKVLGIGCALFKGYFKERSYQMALESDRTARDYLYGRLLAVAESIESYALSRAEKNRDSTAARLMQRFSDRPYSTWRNIELALTPYKSRLRSSERTVGFLIKREKLLDEILGAFRSDEFTSDHALSGEFLLGYHCQRQALSQKREANSDQSEEPNG
ncbi:MAG: type I-C CRISPR-associated protein Cas8c/Csd1 [Nitrospira sp.]|nr:type I-C CRISPR-associated protein Cas8c/Csd1 [Nitrospira sp.]